MSKSIIQKRKECYICRAFANLNNYGGDLASIGLEKHHIIFGFSSKNRDNSEKYGLWVWLCPLHHRIDDISPHKSMITNIAMRRIAQKAFEQEHTHAEWMHMFGRNYLDDGE